MKKKGDVEYGDEAKKMVYSLLTLEPKTIGQITKEMQREFGLNIHYYTVRRLLEELEDQGLVIIRQISRYKICQKSG